MEQRFEPVGVPHEVVVPAKESRISMKTLKIIFQTIIPGVCAVGLVVAAFIGLNRCEDSSIATRAHESAVWVERQAQSKAAREASDANLAQIKTQLF